MVSSYVYLRYYIYKNMYNSFLILSYSAFYGTNNYYNLILNV